MLDERYVRILANCIVGIKRCSSRLLYAKLARHYMRRYLGSYRRFLVGNVSTKLPGQSPLKAKGTAKRRAKANKAAKPT